MSKERDPNDPYDIKGSQRDTEVLGAIAAVLGAVFIGLIFLSVVDMWYATVG